MTQNIFKNLILAFIIVLIGVGGFFYFQKKGNFSSEEVGQKVIDYLNQNIPDAAISLVNVSEEKGLFKITFKMEESEYSVYATKDGELLFPQVISLKKEGSQTESSAGIPKRDVPDVKLFVMSYCPFGLQAEKALLPVWELLKERATFGIYFVDYIIHEKQELDENLRQYCIQKEEPEKFIEYLSCFVQKDDFIKCLNEADIDPAKFTSCQNAADQEFKIIEKYNDKSNWLNGIYPKFEIHAKLNEQYGVAGSPTIVINDEVVNISERSSETFKNAICDLFTSAPAECSQKLSEEVLAPGFGSQTGGASSGSCQ